MKYYSLLLILSSSVVPFISLGQQAAKPCSEASFVHIYSAEALVTAPHFKDPLAALQQFEVTNSRIGYLKFLEAEQLHLHPQDTSLQRAPKKAKSKKDFPKPKVSRKTSKRKARRAKTS